MQFWLLLLGAVASAVGTVVAAEYGGTLEDAQQGVVACTFDGDAALLRGSLLALRGLGNEDPVKVFCVVEEDLSPAWRGALRAVHQVFVGSLPERGVPAGLSRQKLRGFPCKIFALITSPFRRTLVMDPDVLFMRDPSSLWQLRSIVSGGALFFHDRWFPYVGMKEKVTCLDMQEFAKQEGVAWELRPRLRQGFAERHAAYCSGNTSHEQCSSVMLVDKLHPAMLGVLRMLDKVFTEYVLKRDLVRAWGFGDKEFYWLACELAGVDCAFNARGRPHHVFGSAVAALLPQGRWPQRCHLRPSDCGCAAQLDPRDPSGLELLYVHLSNSCADWKRNPLQFMTSEAFAMLPPGAPSPRSTTLYLSSAANATLRTFRTRVLRFTPHRRGP
eukprot:TRINITY_DN112956_c0_g1_i1.p1 TRINITY_DN112956_c0_g1~~TRINITY_DN112956_c0_g1_i1.p1  ORF type:complete len:386 (-),score=69.03 TRINITY_DN112956_c0_g1_i1:42-1199(-)